MARPGGEDDAVLSAPEGGWQRHDRALRAPGVFPTQARRPKPGRSAPAERPPPTAAATVGAFKRASSRPQYHRTPRRRPRTRRNSAGEGRAVRSRLEPTRPARPGNGSADRASLGCAAVISSRLPPTPRRAMCDGWAPVDPGSPPARPRRSRTLHRPERPACPASRSPPRRRRASPDRTRTYVNPPIGTEVGPRRTPGSARASAVSSLCTRRQTARTRPTSTRLYRRTERRLREKAGASPAVHCKVTCARLTSSIIIVST